MRKLKRSFEIGVKMSDGSAEHVLLSYDATKCLGFQPL